MHSDKKQDILEAATKSFALFGYKGTTMDQVAKIANVGKGTIYLFFKNKEELFEEILNNLLLEIKYIAEEEVRPERAFFENLHAFLYRVLDFRMKHELVLKLFQEVKAIGTPIAQEGLKKLEDHVGQHVAKLVKNAMAKGEIKSTDPDIAAFIMVKLYIALVHDWEQNHEPLDKETINQLFQLYLVEGLAK